MNTIETIEYKGFNIDMLYDEYPTSPDEWQNEDTFLVYDHRQFTVQRDGFDPSDIWEHIQETKKWFYEGYYVFPVYAYIHSGVTLSLGNSSYPFTCPWDTSMSGFALVYRMKGWSWSKEKAKEIAKSIVEEWDDYCTGQVYGFNVEDVDSCWGFYGEEGYKYAIEEAKGAIDCHIKNLVKEHTNYLKQAIKSHVLIQYRKQLELR